MKWRIIFLIGASGITYSFLIFNIYQVQIVQSDNYVRLAEARNNASGILEAQRGNIYFTDKNSNSAPAAMNKNFPIIYADPAEIQKNFDSEEINAISSALALALGLPEETVLKQLTKKNDQYEILARKADGEKVTKINELAQRGIYIQQKTLRYYPFGNLASHLLGFVSPTNEKESATLGNSELGRYGAELYFNDELSGKSGALKGDVVIAPQEGQDVHLTIDKSIQAQAETELKKLIEDYRATAGTIIVQEPKTGKVLAMASLPDFDPNNYYDSPIGKFLNPAVQAIYEPGSILKIVTMAAGLDAGKITPDTTYYDTGSFTANGKTIRNWDLKAHGTQTMTGVIEQSINTGAVFAEKKIGNDLFYNYLIKFGFQDPTGVGLPGEVKGNLASLKHGREINFATASYGQGVSMTPIELIGAVSAIANGGVLMKPYISAEAEPKMVRRVISEKAAGQVRDMMVSAVQKNVVAVIPDYNIAGKTGTAFIPNFVKGGYTEEVINTYAGFAPASNPKFTVLVKLDKPEGSPLAGQTVVPAFRELTRFMLNYYNVAPDDLKDQAQ